ncbi:uncharacterized protein LOC121421254 [Lytechinus variegatus]|uniref:uncharacterized protein LOC121421254 n=1 Tax=Lytechinus variegatus TaxID=7654 RepID=UPI001BB25B52|nr:uncharacterized protein LOC121421254 [Lytechinus variegatus]
MADNKGITPLHSASFNGHLDVVKYLIDQGAQANTANNAGVTPLHNASFNGHFDVVKYLIDQGAQANTANNAGITPLHSASFNGHLDVVKYLIDQGAQANTADNEGVTPLHSASLNGHLDVVKYLIDQGAQADTADNADGETALHPASRGGHSNVGRYLKSEQARLGSGLKEKGKTRPALQPSGSSLKKSGTLEIRESAPKATVPALSAPSAVYGAGGSTPRAGRPEIEAAASTHDAPYPVSGPVRLALEAAALTDGASGLVPGTAKQAQEAAASTFGSDLVPEAVRLVPQSVGLRFGTPKPVSEAERPDLRATASSGSVGAATLSALRALDLLDVAGGSTPGSSKPAPGPSGAEKPEGPIPERTWQAQKQTSARRAAGPGQVPTGRATEDARKGSEGLDSVINDEFDDILTNIAKNLYKDSDIDNLGRKLGVRIAAINLYIKRNNQPGERYMGTLEMLRDWREGQKRSQERQVLSSALVAAELIRMNEDYFGTSTMDSQDDVLASGKFDERGGELSVKSYGFILIIPEGALEKDEQIDLRVLTEMPDGLRLQKNEMFVSHGFKLWPTGLHFKRPVKLIIPHCAVVTIPNKIETVLYSRNQSGTFERISHSANMICSVLNKWLEVLISHFCGGHFAIIWDCLYPPDCGILLSCMSFLPRTLPSSRRPVLEVRFAKKIRGQTWKDIHALDVRFQPVKSDDDEIIFRRKKITVSCSLNGNSINPEAIHYEDLQSHLKKTVYFVLDLNKNHDTLVTLNLDQDKDSDRRETISFNTYFQDETEDALRSVIQPVRSAAEAAGPLQIPGSASEATGPALRPSGLVSEAEGSTPGPARSAPGAKKYVGPVPEATRQVTEQEIGAAGPTQAQTRSAVEETRKGSKRYVKKCYCSAKMIVKDIVLVKIAEEFPHLKYTKLCLELGDTAIGASKRLVKHKQDYNEAVMEILVAWKTRTGGYKADLENVLENIEAGGLVGLLK